MPGRPRRVSDEELLRVIAESPDPVVTKNEVSSRVSIGPEACYKRLAELVDGGLLNIKDAGGTNVYWLTDGGKAYLSSRDSETAEN